MLGAAAAALCALVYRVAPPGGDAAAHLYLIELWSRQGWLLWDNLWYAGRHSLVNYSLLFPPAAAILGPGVVVSLSAGAAAGAFGWLARLRWPSAGALPGTVFAASTPLLVIAGTYPFTLGLACGLICLLALHQRRVVWALVAATAATLASPLALAFTVLAAVAAAVADRGMFVRRGPRVAAVGLVVLLVAQFLSTRAFPSPGARYPFDPRDLVAILAFCALGAWWAWRSDEASDLRAFMVVYAVATLAAVVVPTPVGGNMVRITLVVGLPLMVAIAASGRRLPRPIVAALLAAVAIWQITPAVTGLTTAARADADAAEFWQPLDALLADAGMQGYRAHVVATADNWEALYVAGRGVPLTRGWYRQDDFPVNEVLYDDPLTAARYRQWLRDTAVAYVLLPDDPRDAAATREAALVADAGTGLTELRPRGRWRVFAVPDAEPMVTPTTARVTRVTHDEVVIAVDRPGSYRLRLRYSPYFTVTPADAGCVRPRAPWGTTVEARRPGDLRVRFTPSLGRAWTTLWGQVPTCEGSS